MYFTWQTPYAFGRGLSYTSFTYDNLRISPHKKLGANDAVNVSVDVTNSGTR